MASRDMPSSAPSSHSALFFWVDMLLVAFIMTFLYISSDSQSNYNLHTEQAFPSCYSKHLNSYFYLSASLIKVTGRHFSINIPPGKLYSMAREKGRQPSSRSANPAKATSAGPEDFPTSGNENVLDLRPRQTSSSKGSQGNGQKDRTDKSILSQREAAVQSSTSTTLGPSNLLWITTDRPADFKNAYVQREISKHVMHNFQQKDQAGRESGKARRNKSSQSSQSDEDLNGASAPRMPIVERSEVYLTWFPTVCEISDCEKRSQAMPSSLSSSAANANQTPSLFQEMYYPLSVDLDSLEFRERLGQLISRYLRVCKSSSCASTPPDHHLTMNSLLLNRTLIWFIGQQSSQLQGSKIKHLGSVESVTVKSGNSGCQRSSEPRHCSMRKLSLQSTISIS